MHVIAYTALHYAPKFMGKSNTTCRSQMVFKFQHEYLKDYFRNIEILCIFKPSESSFSVRMVFIVGSGVAEFRVVVWPPWTAKSKIRHIGHFQ